MNKVRHVTTIDMKQEKYFYYGGKLSWRGEVVNNILHGRFISYYYEQDVAYISYYSNGFLDGEYIALSMGY